MANKWVMGEGPPQYTYLPHLAYLLWKLDGAFDSSPSAFLSPSIFEGFRAHLEATRIWLESKISGTMGPVDRTILGEIISRNPENPFFLALRARWGDGDYGPAKDLLKKRLDIWPLDVVPLSDGSLGWGSCPDSLLFLLTVAVIEGR